jgi:hypothetical protein
MRGYCFLRVFDELFAAEIGIESVDGICPPYVNMAFPRDGQYFYP